MSWAPAGCWLPLLADPAYNTSVSAISSITQNHKTGNWRSVELFLYQYWRVGLNLLDTALPHILTMIVAQNWNEKQIYFLSQIFGELFHVVHSRVIFCNEKKNTICAFGLFIVSAICLYWWRCIICYHNLPLKVMFICCFLYERRHKFQSVCSYRYFCMKNVVKYWLI